MNLRTKIKESGKTITHLANRLGITRPTMYRIMENPTVATYEQAKTLSSELNLTKKETDDIFARSEKE